MKIFYSQQGEDIYVYKNYINKVCPDGVFVELGAMDDYVIQIQSFLKMN